MANDRLETGHFAKRWLHVKVIRVATSLLQRQADGRSRALYFCSTMALVGMSDIGKRISDEE
jgi:hypothetical protein